MIIWMNQTNSQIKEIYSRLDKIVSKVKVTENWKQKLKMLRKN